MVGFTRDAQGSAILNGLGLSQLLAEGKLPTPAYVYDLDAIAAEVDSLVGAMGGAAHVVAYAVKANSAGSIVRCVAEHGGGADVVSGAELELCVAAGVPPRRIVMSGVAKTDAEIDLALQRDILALQLESTEEIQRVAARAKALGARARVSLRINPSVEIDSHAHIATGHDEAKFGIVQSDLGAAFTSVDASPHLELVGLSTHVGSMLDTPEPYLESARVVCGVARDQLGKGRRLEFVDFGGGFAVNYGDKPCQPPAAFAKAALALLKEFDLSALSLLVEPGRALVGSHGVLLASTIQSKQSGDRRWLMIDAGMNDLIRPALYAARHRIEPLDRPAGGARYQVVGPVCESADDFGLFELGDPAPRHVVIREAGAYGFTMASEYNGRALPAEVFLRGGAVVHVSQSPGASAWVKRRLLA